jgi:hypothetical protein
MPFCFIYVYKIQRKRERKRKSIAWFLRLGGWSLVDVSHRGHKSQNDISVALLGHAAAAFATYQTNSLLTTVTKLFAINKNPLKKKRRKFPRSLFFAFGFGLDLDLTVGRSMGMGGGCGLEFGLSRPGWAAQAEQSFAPHRSRRTTTSPQHTPESG